MSFRFFKSLKTIDDCDQSSSQLKSQLDIVHSYLNIDEWTRKKTFLQVLEQKLEIARRIKSRIMKNYGINDHSQVVGFRCQVCECVFDQPTALGGHMSKAHPDFKKQRRQMQSIKRQIRQSSIEKIKREERQLSQQATGIDRQLFQMARF